MGETLVLEVALDRLRMLRLSEVKGKLSLLAVEQLKLPIYEGGGASNEDIVDGIRWLHRKTGSSGSFVNCILPAKYMLTKTERLPPVEDAKLSRIIQYEIGSYLLINKDDLTYDYQVTNDEMGPSLLLVACRTAVLNEQIALIEGAGLRIKSVEFSPGALFNAYLHNYESDGKLTALLNIGSHETDLVIHKRERLYFARGIVGGFDLFIKALKSRLKVSQEEAERIIEEDAVVSDVGEDDCPTDEISGIVTSQLGELLENVERYLKHWKNDTDVADKDIKKIYLSGYGSLLPNADKYVSSFFGTDTEVFDPLRNISISRRAENAMTCFPSLATHIGAGVRELTSAGLGINLLPEGKKKEINLKKKRGCLLASTILMITVLFTPFIHAHLSRLFYLSRLRSVEKVLNKYEEYIPVVSELSEQGKAIMRRTSVLENLRKGNAYYLGNLASVTQLFPEDIYLQHFLVKLTPEGRTEHFVLGGECRNYNEIEEIVDILNSSALFSGAKVNEITDVKAGPERSRRDEASSNKLGFVMHLAPAGSGRAKLQ